MYQSRCKDHCVVITSVDKVKKCAGLSFYEHMMYKSEKSTVKSV